MSFSLLYCIALLYIVEYYCGVCLNVDLDGWMDREIELEYVDEGTGVIGYGMTHL